MQSDISAVRAQLTANQEKSKTKGSATSSAAQSKYLRLWQAPMPSDSTVRMLPHSDPDAVFAWETIYRIKLPFDGGQTGTAEYDTDQPGTVSIVSPVTFGLRCPITEGIRPWWKTDKDSARKYYRKEERVLNVLLRAAPWMTEQPANPVMVLSLTKSLFSIVDQHLLDPEVDNLPWDTEHGRDFVIRRRSQGEYPNYAQSGFTMKEKALGDADLAAISVNGTHDLRAERGPEPTADILNALQELFEDSVNARPFDAERFGPLGFKFFKNGGFNTAASQTVAPAANANTTSVSAIQAKLRSRVTTGAAA